MDEGAATTPQHLAQAAYIPNHQHRINMTGNFCVFFMVVIFLFLGFLGIGSVYTA